MASPVDVDTDKALNREIRGFLRFHEKVANVS